MEEKKISLELIQKLRERSCAGMMDCKKALAECGCDLEKAFDWLRKKGSAIAEKRSGNKTSEGLVHSYIHAGAQVGVLIEINCETDFVARTDILKQFAHDVCMHIAATRPLCLSSEMLDPQVIARERAICEEKLASEKKPDAVKAQILEGRMKKFCAEVCLLDQPFIKDEKITVSDYLKDIIGKLGENIKIRHFIRYEVGA